MFYGLKHTYYSIKDWFRNCFNRQHFKTVWAAFLAKPWDYSFTYDVLKCRLVESLKYFKKTEIIPEKDRDEIVRQIKLTLSLYDIMSGEKGAGEFEFVTPAERLENPSIKPIKYVQTRYVNARNVDRFAVNKSHARMLKQLPSHLYEAKATKLFWRCMEQYSQNWWD